ncbi:MAG: sugar phosphate isomerase/epimerase family protein [Planctomycetota bacterium]
MRVAFSTNAFTKCSAEEAIASIAKAGYEGVELMLDAPHLFPADATPEKVASIRNAAASAGLAFSNANAFPMAAVGDTWNPSWIDPDPEVRRQRIRHTADALRIASDLGIPNISTEPGGQLPEGVTRDDAMKLFAAGVDEVLPVAEETGVTLLVEPEPHLLIERTSEYLDFAGRISHPNLALNFDIGHFYCVGEDPAEQFRVLRQYARHVHFEDIAASREHRHLRPGDGAIDLPGIVLTMIGEGYSGWITVELYPYEDTPYETACAALQYIRENVEPECQVTKPKCQSSNNK